MEKDLSNNTDKPKGFLGYQKHDKLGDSIVKSNLRRVKKREEEEKRFKSIAKVLCNRNPYFVKKEEAEVISGTSINTLFSIFRNASKDDSVKHFTKGVIVTRLEEEDVEFLSTLIENEDIDIRHRAIDLLRERKAYKK